MGAPKSGYSVRAWLEPADIQAMKILSDRTGLKAVELQSRILSAGIRAVVENGNRITLPLEFEIVKEGQPTPPARSISLNETPPKKK